VGPTAPTSVKAVTGRGGPAPCPGAPGKIAGAAPGGQARAFNAASTKQATAMAAKTDRMPSATATRPPIGAPSAIAMSSPEPTIASHDARRAGGAMSPVAA
jgi:hypothetical protein